MMITNTPEQKNMDRRSFLGAAAAALSAGAWITPAALAQSRADIRKGTDNHSADNPGPVLSLIHI